MGLRLAAADDPSFPIGSDDCSVRYGQSLIDVSRHEPDCTSYRASGALSLQGPLYLADAAARRLLAYSLLSDGSTTLTAGPASPAV